MSKNPIQDHRMRRYLIDAAKNLIKSEGPAAANVRSIADAAGYSFGVIYNYYKDIKELFSICALEFLEECKDYIIRDIKSAQGKEKLIAVGKSCFKYYVQYTGIYDLIFLVKMSEVSLNEIINNAIDNFFDDITAKEWEELYSDSETRSTVKAAYNDALYGSLLMCVNRRSTRDYFESVTRLEKTLNHILR